MEKDTKNGPRTRKRQAYIWMVRHAKAAGNAMRLLNGCRVDAPLSAQGKAQARRLAREWPNGQKPFALLSSPLARAIATARPLAAKWKMGIKLEPLAREQDYGKWTGKKCDELIGRKTPGIHVEKRSGQMYSLNPPEGEAWEEMKKRAARLFRKLDREYAGKKVVLVSHSDFMNCAYAVRNGLENNVAWRRPDVPNCGVVRL